MSIRFIDIYDLVDRELMIRPQKPTVFTLDQLDRLEELGFAEEDLQNFLENFSKLVENGKGIVIGLGDSSKVFPEIIDFFDKRIKIPFLHRKFYFLTFNPPLTINKVLCF